MDVKSLCPFSEWDKVYSSYVFYIVYEFLLYIHLLQTSFGEKLDDVIVTENNMSEMLRLFMVRTNGKEDEVWTQE